MFFTAGKIFIDKKSISKKVYLSVKSVIIQLQIKILSEGVMMTNFISKSSEFIKLLICKKSRGLFLFKRNEKKNHRGTLTPKMPFADRFSCCATIDSN